MNGPEKRVLMSGHPSNHLRDSMRELQRPSDMVKREVPDTRRFFDLTYRLSDGTTKMNKEIRQVWEKMEQKSRESAGQRRVGIGYTGHVPVERDKTELSKERQYSRRLRKIGRANSVRKIRNITLEVPLSHGETRMTLQNCVRLPPIKKGGFTLVGGYVRPDGTVVKGMKI